MHKVLGQKDIYNDQLLTDSLIFSEDSEQDENFDDKLDPETEITDEPTPSKKYHKIIIESLRREREKISKLIFWGK